MYVHTYCTVGLLRKCELGLELSLSKSITILDQKHEIVMIVMQIMMVSGERDTIRGVQIRVGAVLYIYIYMYGGTCAITVAHATHT